MSARPISLRPLVAVLAAALTAGCSIDAPTGPGCTADRPCGDEIVGGVNLTQLARVPSATEVEAARARLAARTAAATGASAPRLTEVALVTSPADGAEIRVVAGVSRANEADTVFFAAIRRPLRAAGDVARRPVVLVLPDAPGALDATDLPSKTGLSATRANDVLVVGLAGRGQPLTVGGRRFAAAPRTGAFAPDPYVSDVDDAQTLAAGLRAFELFAEPARLAAVGLGRGGTSAMLLRARGAITPAVDVDLAVAFAAPSSWFTESTVLGLRRRLSNVGGSALPDFEAVFAATVAPLRAGAIPIAEARLRLTERSPAALLVPSATAPAVLRVLAFYTTLDATVPPDHAGVLLAALAQTGGVQTFANTPREDLATDLEVVTVVTREMTARLSL